MNIFGKNPQDYTLINAQCAGMTHQQVMDCLRASGDKVNWNVDFSRKNFADAAATTAAAFGLVTSNLEAVTAEIENILRERFKIPEFIPMNTSIPEGATSYSIRVVNQYGKGKFINKDGSNVEKATASVGKILFNIEYAGIEPTWTLQELRECLFTGIALDTQTLEAAVQGAMDHIQSVGFEGDADVGFKGLINHDEVPVYQGEVPDFADVDTTADAMIDFVQALVTELGVSTNEIIYDHFGTGPLYMVCPTVMFDRIASKKCSSDATMTVAQYLARNNPWTERTGQPMTFKSLPRMKDAAETGTGRCMVYPFSNRIMEMAMPISPSVITTDASAGYVVKAPMEYSMSGVNMKRPTLMLYADGVLGAGQ